MNICASSPAEFVCHAALNASTEVFSLLSDSYGSSVVSMPLAIQADKRCRCHSSGLDMEEDSAGLIHGLIELSAVAS